MASSNVIVFSVQDETGTVSQLTLETAPNNPVQVGDTGIYAGYPDDGTSATFAPTFAELPFLVTQVLNSTQFSVDTTNLNMADWPAAGTIEWQTGSNISNPSTVFQIDGANAYISVQQFKNYCASRGYSYGTPTQTQIQQAIVQATDYLDQKYKYKGVKLLEIMGYSLYDANSVFVESWLAPYALPGISYLIPSTSTQSTQWPRQGVIDSNGNTVNGIPKQVIAACAELAMRQLNGTVLQPDYNPNVVTNGGVIQTQTNRVGPIETTTTYDTKLGLGFFPDFPQVTRMLAAAGLLINGGGGRTILR